MTNNYLDGVGITRQWSTFALWSSGGLNVLIGNNEVTRTSGGGIHVVSESFKKGLLLWNSPGFNIEHRTGDREDYVINVEYNYVHNYGAGITNDYGGIKTGSKAKNCGVHPEFCHNYIRLYNNLVRSNLVCREERER